VTVNLSKVIRAPIDEVFAFFDDPAQTLEVNAHAMSLEVVELQPDGRRTYDVVMGARARRWMQTVEQVTRIPPTRLVTTGGSWTTDRHKWRLTITTDRRFTAEADGTRVEITIDHTLDRPLRRPLQAIRNWLQQGATRAEFERQLDFFAGRIEGRPDGTPSPHQRHERPRT
jgi:Polyketide cyclase / dehydrase and lipid transport